MGLVPQRSFGLLATIASATREVVSLTRQEGLLRRGPLRHVFVGGMLVFLLLSQWDIYTDWDVDEPVFRNEASTGVHSESDFAYFLHHLDLFPVITELKERGDSAEAAQRIIDERGETLLMESGHTIRYGDLGKTYLYLPSMWLNPGAPRLRPINALVFVSALSALFLALWWARQPVLAVGFVWFVSSNGFQLYEVYRHDNILGWPISTALMLMALHTPLLGWRPPRKYYLYALPVIAGIMLGSVRQIRTEPVVIIVSCAALYLTLGRHAWPKRFMLVGALLVSFVTTNLAWWQFFENKFAHATRVVSTAGGHPYEGPRSLNHLAWHPVWCGLGDFGGDRGYAWDDRVAAAYAAPIQTRRFGVDLPAAEPEDWVYSGHFWDTARKYYKTPYEMPHYTDVLRAKILDDIAQDPIWFVRILALRFVRTLTEAVPAQLRLAHHYLGALPVPGWLLIPVLLLAAYARNWPLMRFCCFPLALMLPAIALYSGRGMTFYSIHVQLTSAVCCAWLCEGILLAYQRRTQGRGRNAEAHS